MTVLVTQDMGIISAISIVEQNGYEHMKQNGYEHKATKQYPSSFIAFNLKSNV